MVGRLHVITDFHFQQKWTHAGLATQAAMGGADVVQFRHKSRSDRHIHHAAKATAEALAGSRTRLIIDDHLALAIVLGADGVHLGQNDLPAETARAAVTGGFQIGVTAPTVDLARRAESDGADYIGYGPIFRTRSKSNPGSEKGLDLLATVSSAVSIPVIAIGGITPANTAAVMQAGAHGVAVMTAISLAPDPASATAEFRTIIDGVTS